MSDFVLKMTHQREFLLVCTLTLIVLICSDYIEAAHKSQYSDNKNRHVLMLRNGEYSSSAGFSNKTSRTAVTEPVGSTLPTNPPPGLTREEPKLNITDNNEVITLEETIKLLTSDNSSSITQSKFCNLLEKNESSVKTSIDENVVFATAQNDTFSALQKTNVSVLPQLSSINVSAESHTVSPISSSSNKSSDVASSMQQMRNKTIASEASIPSSKNTLNVAEVVMSLEKPVIPVQGNNTFVSEAQTNSESQNKSINMQTTFVSLDSPASPVKTVTKTNVYPPEFQIINECGCRRQFFYRVSDYSGSKINSSCSDEGTHYTAGQKVVSFSLPLVISPGDHNSMGSYKVNVMENLRLMRRFYPGYSMRLYTDLPLDSTYCRFLCQNIDLFWCDIRQSIGDQSEMFHPTWKFLPLGDPSVELFLSRDISMFINEREVAAVHDWLKLNKAFHVMRDKRRVHNYPIMGGLWGARNDLLVGDDGDKLRTQIITLSKTPRNKGNRVKNFDQDILARVIFYPRKRDIVAYDSYHCKQWRKFTMVRPFPVQRNHTRVMERLAAIDMQKKIKLLKCPIECRPSYGKDWEFC